MHNRAQLFFDLTLDMLCVAGSDGYFKQLNPAWTRALGYTEEELCAQPFVAFVHPDDQAATIREASLLGAGGHETVHFENRYLHKDGSWRWLSWTAAADPNDGGLLLAVARDITDNKQAEAALRAAKRASDEANLAKSAFLANMSHELRTPLNSIIGFTKLLQRKAKAVMAEREATYVDRILTNSMHLLDLINEVLDLARIESGQLDLQLEAVDLRDVIRVVLQRLEPIAQRGGLEVRAVVPSDLAPLHADRKRTEQILLNLVGNALKFTSEGAVHVRVVADGDRVVRIDVVDSGVGVTPEAQEHIFDAFRQAEESTARRFGGTGLGLPISLELARALGWDIVVDSVPGDGATFSVRIDPEAPLAIHAPPSVGQLASSSAEPAPTRRRIRAHGADKIVLLIDDDPEARLILEQELSAYPCRVVTAGSAIDGIEIARNLRPDLIVLDLMMPEIDGFQALDVLSDDPALRDVPVLVCSIVASDNRLGLAGAVGFLDKPIASEALHEVLHPHLSARSRVLIVDDDADTRLLLAERLENLGLSVDLAAHGVGALARLRAQAPDLILLDLMMPIMDGFAFLRELRHDPRFDAIPVLVVTARDLTRDEDAELRRRAQDVLDKSSLHDGALSAVVARALGAL